MNARLSLSALALAGLIIVPAASQAAPKVVKACMVTANAKCPGAKLQGQNLAGAKMSRADLRNADLRGASLRGGDFRRANLRGANLAGADLRGANFSGANLSFAQLQGTNGSPAPGARSGQASNSSGCKSNTYNNAAQFSGANLTGSNIAGANYSYGNFANAGMEGVNAQGTNFSCSNMEYAKMASVPNMQASNANGRCYVALYTNVQGANFQGAYMVGLGGTGWSTTAMPAFTPACSKSGGSYTPPAQYYVDWSTANISYANLQSAQFRYAILPTGGSSSLYQGATWSSTQCPNGTLATGSPCPANP